MSSKPAEETPADRGEYSPHGFRWEDCPYANRERFLEEGKTDAQIEELRQKHPDGKVERAVAPPQKKKG